MGWIKETIGRFFHDAAEHSDARLEQEDMLVYYAGADESDAEAGEYEFGIYFCGEGEAIEEAVWLPCVTSDESVIEQLKAMEVGQGFYITGEDSNYCDSIGTCVTAIRVSDDLPKHDVGALKHAAFTL